MVIIITYADIAWKPVFRWKSRLIDHTKLNVISTIKHLSSFTLATIRYLKFCRFLNVFVFTFIIRRAMNYVWVCVCFFQNINTKKAFLEIEFFTFDFGIFFLPMVTFMYSAKCFLTVSSNECLYMHIDWEILDRYTYKCLIRNFNDKNLVKCLIDQCRLSYIWLSGSNNTHYTLLSLWSHSSMCCTQVRKYGVISS